jgi:hypothetical protein
MAAVISPEELVARRATELFADGKFLASETGVATTAAIERNVKKKAVRDIRFLNREKIATKRRLVPQDLERSKSMSMAPRHV